MPSVEAVVLLCPTLTLLCCLCDPAVLERDMCALMLNHNLYDTHTHTHMSGYWDGSAWSSKCVCIQSIGLIVLITTDAT